MAQLFATEIYTTIWTLPFHLMIDKKISNAQLKEKAGFSANIITRLKRNEYVSIESIEKICRVMECGVDDILEFVPEEK